eukprot:CAMPEP_0172486228 /NCGR_PEP_ID=MMETSP1066-20121228/14708_1 /TAXON_ID=671091 /ORGANISM="Coscinodiscus wailesii, Strain CCMP2513" /LENGTH=361 /DNA_ID=CAMNT_0013252045 /DNA_START=174 /DNA_END=1259 /DNA_ORIENTATION=-
MAFSAENRLEDKHILNDKKIKSTLRAGRVIHQPRILSDNGFCNWGPEGNAASSTCSGGAQGGTWCNQNQLQCQTCRGRWCTTSSSSMCGCASCTSSVLSKIADGYPVRNRINWVIDNRNKSEKDACELVCGDEFPHICADCNPRDCSGNPNSGKTATTTRYWDCSGGSCGCGYGQSSNPIHCESGALFRAPSNNVHGAQYYGSAAVSAALGGDNWQGPACGKCFKLTALGKTIVVKATNFCPSGNAACENGKAHFDIAAPGFDFSGTSLSNTCTSAYPGDTALHPPQVCSVSGVNGSCNCDAIQNPTLRQGCKNFLSLGWDNPSVVYEAVSCPSELVSSPPCRSDGVWPNSPPQGCAVPLV